MKLKVIADNCRQSEDGRVMIYKEIQSTSYYRGRNKYYRKETIYTVYIDGKPLKFSEGKLEDAIEMAEKHLRKEKLHGNNT